MNRTRSLLKGMIACGVALAVVSTLAAESTKQISAKVAHLKGSARYATGPHTGQLLKVGDEIPPGSVIQTASDSRIDLMMGGGPAPAKRPGVGDTISYTPQAEQNVVRLWPNTLLGIDKLTETQTGADVVTETQLDLKAGHIFGSVKKMSSASKYEIKIPNGVAGIKGTVYDISAEGVLKVRSGVVVLAYVGPDGTTPVQPVNANQMFDARTGALTPLPDMDKASLDTVQRQVQQVMAMQMTIITPAPVQYITPQPQGFISPH
jgi:hypothetical protein